MTARRQARAVTAPIESADGPPAVLYDPDAAVWHDRDLYVAFMARHGWTLPSAERLGGDSHPVNRRSDASSGWAEENGITSSLSGHADWHRLRELGLIDDGRNTGND